MRLLEAYLSTRRRVKTSRVDGVAHANGRRRAGVVSPATPMAAMARAAKRVHCHVVATICDHDLPPYRCKDRDTPLSRSICRKELERSRKPDAFCSIAFRTETIAHAIFESPGTFSPAAFADLQETPRSRSAISPDAETAAMSSAPLRGRSEAIAHGATATHRSDQPLQSRQQDRDDLRISILHRR